jgi:hypothetical protein
MPELPERPLSVRPKPVNVCNGSQEPVCYSADHSGAHAKGPVIPHGLQDDRALGLCLGALSWVGQFSAMLSLRR